MKSKVNTNLQRIATEAAEIAAFCIEHRGRCFPTGMSREGRQGREGSRWSDKKVFAYVAFHLMTRSCIVTRFADGKIAGVAFAWPEIEAKVRERAANDEPQFRWTIPNAEGDCIFIAEVIGSRLAVALMAIWYRDTKCPQFETLPKLTYRRGKLTQLQNGAVSRFGGAWLKGAH